MIKRQAKAKTKHHKSARIHQTIHPPPQRFIITSSHIPNPPLSLCIPHPFQPQPTTQTHSPIPNPQSHSTNETRQDQSDMRKSTCRVHSNPQPIPVTHAIPANQSNAQPYSTPCNVSCNQATATKRKKKQSIMSLQESAHTNAYAYRYWGARRYKQI
ncbi:hypothetical protein IAQ61_009322 [Plenodomus lingam]|uniref:uncharacterized protein n=1 Tax=Leptosphaeria maculans TaxID=5022 RepID=UPI0033199B82|nr:hypothetical protein IAQ61_009322 [Plenodomus lingam]